MATTTALDGGGGQPPPQPGQDFSVETTALEHYSPVLAGIGNDWDSYVKNPVSGAALTADVFGWPGKGAGLPALYEAARQRFVTMSSDAHATFDDAASTLVGVAENYGATDAGQQQAIDVVGKTLGTTPA
jgi:hypothetical protein